MALKDPLESPTQLKDQMISFLNFELLHVSSSCLIYKLHSHIKELRKPLSPHQILRLLTVPCLNFEDCVATPDILN